MVDMDREWIVLDDEVAKIEIRYMKYKGNAILWLAVKMEWGGVMFNDGWWEGYETMILRV